MTSTTARLIHINDAQYDADRGEIVSYDTVGVFDADGEQVAEVFVESSELAAAYDAALAAAGYPDVQWEESAL